MEVLVKYLKLLHCLKNLLLAQNVCVARPVTFKTQQWSVFYVVKLLRKCNAHSVFISGDSGEEYLEREDYPMCQPVYDSEEYFFNVAKPQPRRAPRPQCRGHYEFNWCLPSPMCTFHLLSISRLVSVVALMSSVCFVCACSSLLTSLGSVD